MNEQIKHFAEQSNIKFRVSDIDPSFWSYDENSLTKFAESIIKECCDQVIHCGAEYIKEHFGIEE